MMHVTGEADGPPAKVGYAVTDLGAGMFGAMGVLSALVARQKTGKGEWVDTSLLEAGMAWSLLTAGNYFAAVLHSETSFQLAFYEVSNGGKNSD